MTMRPGPLTASEVEAFDRDGFVILRNFFPPEVIASARRGLTAIMEARISELEIDVPGLVAKAEDAPFETRFRKVFDPVAKVDPSRVPLAFRPELHHEDMYPILFNDKLLDAVQQLLPESVNDIRLFPNFTARPKLPEFTPHRVAWHQDAGIDHRGAPNSAPAADRLRAFGRNAMVNVWTGLVPVSRKEGCMLMIPGTQSLGCVEHVIEGDIRKESSGKTVNLLDTMEDDTDVAEYSEGYQKPDRKTYTSCIRKDIVDSAIEKREPVAIETRPGDVVLFQNLTFHCGTTNTSEIVRWSIDWRYQDAEQPTHRPPQGYLARSDISPEKIPASGKAWAALPFK